MLQIFSMDGPLYKCLSTLANIVIINILWLITMIPVVTFGPATEAAYYTLTKVYKGEDSKIIRKYFKEFKDGFKKNVPAGLIVLISAAVVAGDLFIFYNLMNSDAYGMSKQMIKILGIAFVILYIILFSFFMPLMATFENSIKQNLKNSLLLGVRRFYIALPMGLITLIPLMVFLYDQQFFMKTFVLYLMLGLGGPAYINVILFRFAVKEYLPKEEES
ncbi:MAG: DUF624 domain-containing protein [Eubacterium sp.]|nr:DUF624 domain-containing protein [Eubacterium sp.]